MGDEEPAHEGVGDGRSDGADEQSRAAADAVAERAIDEEGATVDDRTDAEDMPECLVRHESGFVEGGFGDG